MSDAPTPTNSLRRNLDIFALGLLGAGLLLAVCLFSYDPADPPGRSVYPGNEHVENVLGRPGAWLAHVLISTLGLGVCFFLAAWFLLAIVLLARKQRLTYICSTWPTA